MKRMTRINLMMIVTTCLPLLLFAVPTTKINVDGTIFDDLNDNGILDKQDKGIQDVWVSDGEQIVKTDAQGHYSLTNITIVPYGTIFITKPSGYKLQNKFYKYYQATASQTINFALKKYKEAKEVSFVAIADAHLGKKPIYAKDLKEDLAEVTTIAQNRHCNFILSLGDMTDYGKPENLDSLSQLYNSLPTPIFPVFGAHSALTQYYDKSLNGDSTIAYRQYIGPTYYAFNFEEYHFLVLVAEHGFLSKTQQERYNHWLDRELDLLNPKTKLIIFQHKQLKYKTLLKFKHHNLIGNFYGHWHDGHTRYRHNRLTVSVPPVTFGGYYVDNPRGCNVVTLKDDKIDVKLINLGLNNYISLNSFHAGDRHLYVAAYNATSPISKLTVSNEAGKFIEMQHIDGWLWQVKSAGFNLNKNKILTFKATTASGKSFTKTFTVQVLKSKKSGLRFHKTLWSGGSFLSNNHPVIKDNNLFITVNNYSVESPLRGAVLSLNLTDMRLNWKYQTDNSIKGSLTYGDKNLYISTTVGDLYALNLSTGNVDWKFIAPFDREGRNFSTPVYHNNSVYAFSSIYFRRFDADTGKVIWTATDHKGTKIFLYDTTPKPLIVKDKIYIFSADIFYCLDINTGKELWHTKAKGRHRYSPTYSDGLIYSQAGESNEPLKQFKAIDSETGSVKWSAISQSGWYSSTIDKNSIYVSCDSGKVIALDKNRGETLWEFKTKQSLVDCARYKRDSASVTSPVTALTNRIIFGANDGYVYLLDKTTGKLLSSYNLGIPILTSVAVKNNLIYVPTLDGHIYILKLF